MGLSCCTCWQRKAEFRKAPPELRQDQLVPEQMCVADFQVRIWNIGEKTQKLREVLKEHRGAVSCIKTNKNDKEGVTASLDGTCVIWDLE